MSKRVSLLLLLTLVCATASFVTAQQSSDEPIVGFTAAVKQRKALANSVPRQHNSYALMSPQDRRQAIDAFWGPGPSTAEKLAVFDKYWNYVDQHDAAFQGIDIDWNALRARYRPEIAAGVSRGRFAAIMNQMALALREGHTNIYDLDVNIFTVPDKGIPLMAVTDWTYNNSGACSTAQPDGSALVYSVMPNHPLGLQRGDVVLGYDGRPWRQLYQELLDEELPLWSLWWGSSPSSFSHTFESSVTMNWHLFETMDIKKASGDVVHVPTSLMPGPIFYGFCSEQMAIPGVPKPKNDIDDTVGYGVITGTDIGYLYIWAWGENSEVDFEQAILDLTQVKRVKALIVDFRFNEGGLLFAPYRGLGALFDHPVPTLAVDDRMNPTDHFKMKKFVGPSYFNMDFAGIAGPRIKLSYGGPIALLVGPGAGSTGDMSSYWMSRLPNVRSFGKSTASSFNYPTQPLLGRELDLGPDWFARIAEANFYAVGSPNTYLTHTEFPVDEPVWLKPEDVKVGKDTVVEAALRWINQQP